MMRRTNHTRLTLFILLAGSLLGPALFSPRGGGVRAQAVGKVVHSSEVKGTAIGTRRELFVEDTLIEAITGEARQVLHHPTPREVVLVNDMPWEGNGLNYMTVFHDGENYRMYYRGANYDVLHQFRPLTQEVTCVALSKDGIHWERPKLGLIEFQGSKENNIVMIRPLGHGQHPKFSDASHHFAPFVDTNPDAPKSERFKGVGGGPGILGWVSKDGFAWNRVRPDPIITRTLGDSLNTCLWDPVRKEYHAYSRTKRYAGRDVLLCKSKKFNALFSQPVTLEYTPSRAGQLYTNGIIIYDRAPHYHLGFPTRIEDRGFTPSAKYLPDQEYRARREKASATLNQNPGDGYAATEGLFMASRDGVNFRLYEEAFARPGLRTKDTWVYGDMYQARGVLETPSATFEDAPNELSLYFNESCLRIDRPGKMRRYTLRLDGFVSIYATMPGGMVTTRLLNFTGKMLTLNYSSSVRGGVRVGFVNEIGQPIDGYSLDECPWIYGDHLDRPVEWNRGKEVTTDVGPLAGRALKVIFELKDADLYSYRFVDE